MDLVRSIGADHVIDYTQVDFTQREPRYDLILDIVANRSVAEYARALTPTGQYVAVAFNPRALFSGAVTGGRMMLQLDHTPKVTDLKHVKELIEAGKVVPVINRQYPLSAIAEALQYYAEGHPRG